jgi:F-type H+-transporting ATPase subunit delta
MMSNLIAKKYVKAILEGRDVSSAAAVYNELSQIASAFNDEKFNGIIASSEASTDQKVDLIISFVENCSEATKNLIKLLGSNKRLNMIADISAELKAQIDVLNNSYEGIVYTNSELSSDYIATIEEKFSNKFNVNLKLVQNVCDYDGIKVDIDGLGLEIGFSKDRLKSQMIEHILKAV